jgi:hypothetical protein
MPVYTPDNNRLTVTTHIPSIEGSEIVLYDELTVGDQEQIQSMQNKGSIGALSEVIKMLIKSWNLTKEDETPLEVTAEIIKSFTSSDITHLLKSTKQGQEFLKTAEEVQEDTLKKKVI